MAQTTPFTYLIGWSKYDLWYYGVRYRDGCDPSDLFTNYFTSSKRVHHYMLQYGLPDVIQIRRTFESRHKALIWEQTVLRRMNVLKHTKWLNQNIRGAIEFDERIRQVMSEAKKGRTWMHKNGKRMLVHKDLVSVYQNQGYKLGHLNGMKGAANHMFGKQHSNETKDKIGKANSRSTLTEKGRRIKSELMSNTNPMHDEKIREKHKDAMKKRKDIWSKCVYYNGVRYKSVTEAHKAFPNESYSNIAFWSKHNKKGWTREDPALVG